MKILTSAVAPARAAPARMRRVPVGLRRVVARWDLMTIDSGSATGCSSPGRRRCIAATGATAAEAAPTAAAAAEAPSASSVLSSCVGSVRGATTVGTGLVGWRVAAPLAARALSGGAALNSASSACHLVISSGLCTTPF